MTTAPHRRRRRPLRTILVVSGLLLLVAVLVAPGVLGLIVHRQVEAWAAESWPDATTRWQRGWFASRIEAADGEAHIALDIQHSPLRISGPLSAEGPVTLSEPATRVDVQAILDWRFDLSVTARTEAVTSRSTVTTEFGPATLSFHRARDGALDIRFDGQSLTLSRPGAAVLELGPTVATLTGDGRDPGRLALVLDTQQRGADGTDRLDLKIEGIDRERAAAWREALANAQAAPTGTTMASVAWLGVASAWEQLARSGLVLRLEPLELRGGQAEFTGRWRPADSDLQIEGRGRLDTVRAWVVPVMSLSTGDPVDALMEEFDLQVQALAGQAGVDVDGARFRVDWPPASR